MAAEDYVRRLEAGAAAEVAGDNNIGTEDQSSPTVKVMCRICFSGENEGSDRALKMLSCKVCSKKYHRSCLKVWAEYRDLFHWSSWACPSCRICEFCGRAGDPTKFMFCKRCDGAYHCYCQQPPHKNVSHGPYLCPKHTRCHSCGSTIPGNGLSTRWFLGYTCCDACGRLFVKGKYCPVCLKVYRDSEMTPMVCCDVCQQWVHCVCDGISDEKYQQFQADGNLYYRCPACRGDCYQVKDIDDAVRELWRRRDKADHDLTMSLRAAAGLPTQEEIFSICPYSDDEDSGPVILKTDNGKPLKFSVKGLTDKSSKNSKEYWKNSKKLSNKKHAEKEYQVLSVGKPEEPFDDERQLEALESSFGDQKIRDGKPDRTDGQDLSSPLTRSPGTDGGKSYDGQLESHNDSLNEEAVGNKSNKVPKVYIKGNKQGLHMKEGGSKYSSKTETVKGTKLVIHLAKNTNMASSPRSEASSCHKDQDQSNSNGSESTGLQKTKDSESYMLDTHPMIAKSSDWKEAKIENSSQLKVSTRGDREGSVIKLRKISDMHKENRANTTEQSEQTNAFRSTLKIRRTSTELDTGMEAKAENAVRSDGISQEKHCVGSTINLLSKNHNKAELQSASNSSNDPKPLLKLKFKSPYFEQRNSLTPTAVEEKNPIKGQRSKRKRPSVEKLNSLIDENFVQLTQEDPGDEDIDASWILQKLGKDAIGKRVEVHEAADNSWRKGVVSNVIEGTSSISVRLDNGRSKTLQLGKQAVRFISQKLKRVPNT